MKTTSLNQTRRFRSGYVCPDSGRYLFDGYSDSFSGPDPEPYERQILLMAGEPFPTIGDAADERMCYWKAAEAEMDTLPFMNLRRLPDEE